MHQYLKEFIELKRIAAYDLPNENYRKSNFFIVIRNYLVVLLGINFSVFWFNLGNVFYLNIVVPALLIWCGITFYFYFFQVPKKIRFFALIGIASLIPIYLQNYEFITKAEQVITDWFSTSSISF